MSKEDHLIILVPQILNLLALNAKNRDALNPITRYIFESYWKMRREKGSLPLKRKIHQ